MVKNSQDGLYFNFFHIVTPNVSNYICQYCSKATGDTGHNIRSKTVYLQLIILF